MLPYTITPARYSKGNFIVQTHNDGPWKGRAERLICDGLNCRYVGRSKGFMASPSKVARFERLYAEGWDANSFTGELQPLALNPRPLSTARKTA